MIEASHITHLAPNCICNRQRQVVCGLCYDTHDHLFPHALKRALFHVFVSLFALSFFVPFVLPAHIVASFLCI